MSWLTEVRQALKGLEVEAIETDIDTITVTFEHMWVFFKSDRAVQLCGPKLLPNNKAILDTIWSRLDRRVWRVE